MRKTKAKKLKKMAAIIMANKTPEEVKAFYRRLKKVK